MDRALLFSTNNLLDADIDELLQTARSVGVTAVEFNERYDSDSLGNSLQKIEALRSSGFSIPIVNLLLDWPTIKSGLLSEETFGALEAVKICSAEYLNIYILPHTCDAETNPDALASFLTVLRNNPDTTKINLLIENVAAPSAPEFLRCPLAIADFIRTNPQIKLGLALDIANALMSGHAIDPSSLVSLGDCLSHLHAKNFKLLPENTVNVRLWRDAVGRTLGSAGINQGIFEVPQALELFDRHFSLPYLTIEALQDQESLVDSVKFIRAMMTKQEEALSRSNQRILG